MSNIKDVDMTTVKVLILLLIIPGRLPGYIVVAINIQVWLMSNIKDVKVISVKVPL
jgi:hypothetical protein